MTSTTTGHTPPTEQEGQIKGYAPSVLAELRALMPNRPLRFAEAQRLAELQANRLLRLTDSTSAPVADAVITELPRIEVKWVGSLIGSGATSWSRGMWRIRLNGAEPATRQRFTLAHEFKHILDAAYEDSIYRHLPAGPARDRHIEGICDHFAACLLMPKAWVKSLWCRGVQDLSGLAWRFAVSQAAMLIRLQNLGLVDRLPRHAISHRLGAVAVRSPGRSPASRRRSPDAPGRYRRLACPDLSSHLLQGVPL
jgi:Zn-dependent peptidase ImmA (M78 family)